MTLVSSSRGCLETYSIAVCGEPRPEPCYLSAYIYVFPYTMLRGCSF